MDGPKAGRIEDEDLLSDGRRESTRDFESIRHTTLPFPFRFPFPFYLLAAQPRPSPSPLHHARLPPTRRSYAQALAEDVLDARSSHLGSCRRLRWVYRVSSSFLLSAFCRRLGVEGSGLLLGMEKLEKVAGNA